MKELRLGTEGIALVDDEDFERLSKRTWRYHKGGWADSSLAQEILGIKGMVDHKNGNALDFQKSNLRLCTYSQNGQNSRKTRNKTSSKYKGVYFCKRKCKWRALVGLIDAFGKSSQKHLGYFKIEEEAAKIYDEAARLYHKEFACLNFPNEGERSCL